MSTLKSKCEITLTPSGSSENLSSITLDRENGEDVCELDIDLLSKMGMEDIEELKRQFFDETKIKRSKQAASSDAFARGASLDKAEFIEIIEKLTGSSMVSLSAAKLFESLDSGNKGAILWENVLDAIIAKTRELLERKKKNWQPVNPEISIHCASHCKREFIVKIVLLRTKLTFCYAVVSKLGRVGVYDGEFNLLDVYKIGLKPMAGNKKFLTGEQEERQRLSNTTWVTDAVFVPDTYAIFFAASDRSLHLYDATGLIHVPLCLIGGLKNIPTCLDYYSSQDRTKSSFLFFGDDEGDVTMMEFHQPKKSLLKKKDPDKLDKFLWSELKEQLDYVTCRIHKRVHDQMVLQISYNSESKTVLSCSNDPVNSMILLHTEKRRQPCKFRVAKGIKCFHLEKSLRIIVTGSKDCLVRIWNQVVTNQPIVSLRGHREPVVDVKILKHLSVIMSLSEKGIVKIWNLDDYYCQMSLQLNFPVFKTVGSRIEFGTKSIYPGPTVSKLFDELGIPDSKEASKINSFADDIETWLSSKEFEAKYDQEWSGNSVAIICCNSVAFLKLNPVKAESDDDDDAEDDPRLLKKHTILPPPSRELYASIPSPWKIADSFTRTPPDESEELNTSKSSNSSSSAKTAALTRTLRKAQSITADPVKAPMNNMNKKKTQLGIRQDQMKMLVEHCAPHLALNLYDLAPLKFSRPLPMTRRMREKGIDASDPENLLKWNLMKESTTRTSEETFSDLFSPRSCKSSKLAGPKKNSGKERQTPDWLAERFKSSRRGSSESDQNSSKLTA